MRVEVWMRPPYAARQAAKALVMDCEPPRAIGHPTAWAETPITMPKEALKGSSRLKKECAANPAKRARARSVRNRRRATRVAEGRASIANFVSRNGCCGHVNRGRKMSCAISGQ